MGRNPAAARCDELAARLRQRGHLVELVVLGDGAERAGPPGAVVRRVEPPADEDVCRFRPGVSRRPVALSRQEEWMVARTGPVAALQLWLAETASRYDVVTFFGYGSPLTWAGLPACAGRVATLLHPLPVEGAEWHLPLFDTALQLPTVHAFVDADEEALVTRRLGRHPVGARIGAGVDLAGAGDGAVFRLDSGLDDRPYLVCLGPGRTDLQELEYFARYKRARPGPLAMVVGSDKVGPAPASGADVVVVQASDAATWRNALAGALAVVRPSCDDGSSVAFAEARAEGRAALVNGRSPAMAVEARLTLSAVAYAGSAEFGAAVDLLLADEDLRRRLGAAGRRLVEEAHGWESVAARYERLLWVAQNHR
jgi:glycosyltransferase involved in cell wall biosynthesis